MHLPKKKKGLQCGASIKITYSKHSLEESWDSKLSCQPGMVPRPFQQGGVLVMAGWELERWRGKAKVFLYIKSSSLCLSFSRVPGAFGGSGIV